MGIGLFELRPPLAKRGWSIHFAPASKPQAWRGSKPLIEIKDPDAALS